MMIPLASLVAAGWLGLGWARSVNTCWWTWSLLTRWYSVESLLQGGGPLAHSIDIAVSAMKCQVALSLLTYLELMKL